MSVSTAQFPLLPERRFPYPPWQHPFVSKYSSSFFDTASPSSSSSWDTTPNWPNDHSSYCPQTTTQLSNASLLSSSEYPQRTILPPSPPSISGAIIQPESFTRAPSRSTSSPLDRNRREWSKDLYESEHLSSLDTPSIPAVKLEPDDSEDGFIMELVTPDVTDYLQSLVPPTEVPLRATQASKEMRKMMGVFRLNPFAMHNGSGKGVSSSAWYAEDVGPLEHEPVLLEFQIELGEAPIPIVLKGEGADLRSFSPDFEVDGSSGDGSSRSEWTEPDSETAFRTSPLDPWMYTPTPPPTYHHLSAPDLIPDEVSTGAQLPFTPSDRSKRVYPAQGRISTPQRQSNSNSPSAIVHNSTSRTRTPRRPSSEPSSWPSPPTSRPKHNPSTFQVPSSGSSDENVILFLGAQGYGASLPSIAAMSRRWSLPASNPNAPFLM